MEDQRITIPWDDGSGQDITIKMSKGEGDSIKTSIYSPFNNSLNSRKKVLELSSVDDIDNPQNINRSIDLEISQGPNDLTVGGMQVGISFLIR